MNTATVEFEYTQNHFFYWWLIISDFDSAQEKRGFLTSQSTIFSYNGRNYNVICYVKFEYTQIIELFIQLVLATVQERAVPRRVFRRQKQCFLVIPQYVIIVYFMLFLSILKSFEFGCITEMVIDNEGFLFISELFWF